MWVTISFLDVNTLSHLTHVCQKTPPSPTHPCTPQASSPSPSSLLIPPATSAGESLASLTSSLIYYKGAGAMPLLRHLCVLACPSSSTLLAPHHRPAWAIRGSST